MSYRTYLSALRTQLGGQDAPTSEANLGSSSARRVLPPTPLTVCVPPAQQLVVGTLRWVECGFRASKLADSTGTKQFPCHPVRHAHDNL